TQVCATLQQMRRERVAEEMRVHALGVEAGLRGETTEDQERAGARERTTARIEEELRPVPHVEERTAAREVPAYRFDGGPADRDDTLLVSLAEGADDPVLEVDVRLREADGLADAQAGAVEKLDERAVAVCARRGACGGFDQPLRLRRRERAREPRLPARQVELRGRIVRTRAEQHLVAEERAERGNAARDRCGRESRRAQLGEVRLELLDRRARDRAAEPLAERVEVPPVRLDGARCTLRSEQGEEAVEVAVGHQDRGCARS